MDGDLKLIQKLHLMRRASNRWWTKGWTNHYEVLTNHKRGLDHSDLGISWIVTKRERERERERDLTTIRRQTWKYYCLFCASVINVNSDLIVVIWLCVLHNKICSNYKHWALCYTAQIGAVTRILRSFERDVARHIDRTLPLYLWV
jgi:hypothetical protein